MLCAYVIRIKGISVLHLCLVIIYCVLGPGTVAKFQNISRTQTSILLRWEVPDRPNGELKKYLVSITVQ